MMHLKWTRGAVVACTCTLATCGGDDSDSRTSAASLGDGVDTMGQSTSTSAGDGSDTSAGSTGYAFVDELPGEVTTRTEAVEIPLGATAASIEFVWTAQPGWPAKTDLEILGSAGDPLVQVFTTDDRPFIRIGLDVHPLAPDVGYVVRLGLGDDGTQVTVSAGDEVIVRATVRDTAVRSLQLTQPHADLSAAPAALGDITFE